MFLVSPSLRSLAYAVLHPSGADQGIPGITGIDTRRLTQKIRQELSLATISQLDRSNYSRDAGIVVQCSLGLNSIISQVALRKSTPVESPRACDFVCFCCFSASIRGSKQTQSRRRGKLTLYSRFEMSL